MRRRMESLPVAGEVGYGRPVGMHEHVHDTRCDNEPVAHNTQHFVQALSEQRVRPDAIKIGEASEEIRGGIAILETEGRSDRIQSLAGHCSFVSPQDWLAVPSVEHEIPAVRIIVRMLLQPSEGQFRKLQTFPIQSEFIAGDTGGNRIGGAMPMFRRPFKGFAGPVEHPVPTSQTTIPHPLLEILKAVCSCLRQVFQVRKMSGSPGGCRCFPRLVLEHLELGSSGFPPVVESTKEAAVLTISGTWK